MCAAVTLHPNPMKTTRSLPRAIALLFFASAVVEIAAIPLTSIGIAGFFAASFRTVVVFRSVAGAPSALSSAAPENFESLVRMRHPQ